MFSGCPCANVSTSTAPIVGDYRFMVHSSKISLTRLLSLPLSPLQCLPLESLPLLSLSLASDVEKVRGAKVLDLADLADAMAWLQEGDIR